MQQRTPVPDLYYVLFFLRYYLLTFSHHHLLHLLYRFFKAFLVLYFYVHCFYHVLYVCMLVGHFGVINKLTMSEITVSRTEDRKAQVH